MEDIKIKEKFNDYFYDKMKDFTGLSPRECFYIVFKDGYNKGLADGYALATTKKTEEELENFDHRA